MGGNRVFLTVICVLIVVCSNSCSASGSWKKYSFDPNWAVFGKRGALKVSSNLEVISTRNMNVGNSIDSIQIQLPQGIIQDILPNSIVVFAQDGWHSKKSFEFYLKGIYRYAKKNPSHVICELDLLCKVDYSLVPLHERGKADSYFDYMLSSSADIHAYVNQDLLESDLWNPALLVEAYFTECRAGIGCLRKGLFNNYLFEYSLQPPENIWHVIDAKIKKFLIDNVNPE